MIGRVAYAGVGIMIVKEINARTILSKSKVSDYTINPYIGCEHGCTYCYARFIKRITGHREAWGEFIDVKVNAPSLLEVEIKRKRVGKVWISGICDPYQPIERKYELTRNCLEILLRHNWPVTIQTKSPLVLRDIDLLINFEGVEVVLTIATSDDEIRRIFEPKAPPIEIRIDALDKLHRAGVNTCAMIAPILPKAEGLIAKLSGKVDYVLIDRMNYHYADWIYRKHGFEYAMDEKFFNQMRVTLVNALKKEGLDYHVLF